MRLRSTAHCDASRPMRAGTTASEHECSNWKAMRPLPKPMIVLLLSNQLAIFNTYFGFLNDLVYAAEEALQ